MKSEIQATQKHFRAWLARHEGHALDDQALADLLDRLFPLPREFDLALGRAVDNPVELDAIVYGIGERERKALGAVWTIDLEEPRSSLFGLPVLDTGAGRRFSPLHAVARVISGPSLNSREALQRRLPLVTEREAEGLARPRAARRVSIWPHPDLIVVPNHGLLFGWAPETPAPIPIGLLDARLLCGDASVVPDDDAVARMLALAAGRLVCGSASRGRASLRTPTGRVPADSALCAASFEERVFLTSRVRVLPGTEGFFSPQIKEGSPLTVSELSLFTVLGSAPSAEEAVQWVLGSAAKPKEAAALRKLVRGALATGAIAARTVDGSQSDAISHIAPVSSIGQAVVASPTETDGRTPVCFVSGEPNYHLPLALGMLRAAAEERCPWFHFRILSTASREEIERLAKSGPGVWLFSNYVWSLEANLAVSRRVKEIDPQNLVIHGGPSTPSYEEACRSFLQVNPFIDVAARGEGENTLVEILSCLSEWDRSEPLSVRLGAIGGIAFRDPAGKHVRTPDRPPEREIDRFPSPYLKGVFDGYPHAVVSAIVETNRGCPYGCTFCDWGSATLQKIRRFDQQRVFAEIDWIGRHHIKVLWIADANFGILDRDVEIARFIAATKRRYGFPREVTVNYAKNATQRLAEIVAVFKESGLCTGGIISIQTTAPATLAVIRRSNIKEKRYDELADIFRTEGLPLSTDLMYGLPGSSFETLRKDLLTYFEKDIAVKLYPTVLLPNSPMADPDYMKRYAIRTNARSEVVASFTFDEHDWARMGRTAELWVIFEEYSVLRYVLRYLWWDHQIHPVDAIEMIARAAASEPAKLPSIAWVMREFRTFFRPLTSWEAFYADVARCCTSHFDIALDSAFDASLRANRAVMPEEGRRFPDAVGLSHDFGAFFAARSKGESPRPLASYPPGELLVEDPYALSDRPRDVLDQYDRHQVNWELETAMARHRPAPHFIVTPAARRPGADVRALPGPVDSTSMPG